MGAELLTISFMQDEAASSGLMHSLVSLVTSMAHIIVAIIILPCLSLICGVLLDLAGSLLYVICLPL